MCAMDSTEPAQSPLARFRKRLGLTQEALASEIGLNHPASVSALETGKDAPSLEMALRIEVFSKGEVRAADLRPDLAELIGAFVQTTSRPLAEAAA